MAADAELRQEIIDIYRKRAKNYDITANLYYLIGYPEWKYRRVAVDALDLQRGDTVVEVACGTGLNFGLYQERIGSEGRIIGVDLTDAMLAQARQRVDEQGWKNVELIHRDASQYTFPEQVDGIISTFALSLIPEAPQIVERGASALAPGGKWAVLDFEIPANWPGWLTSALVALTRPFAVTDEWLAREPWEDIQWAMREHTANVALQRMYLGMTYLLSGEAA